MATGQTACPCAQAVQDGDILVAQVGIEHIAVGVRYPQCAYSSRPSQGCAVHTEAALGLSDPAQATWTRGSSTKPGWVEQGAVSVVSRHEAVSEGCTGRGTPVARRVQCTLHGSRSRVPEWHDLYSSVAGVCAGALQWPECSSAPKEQGGVGPP